MLSWWWILIFPALAGVYLLVRVFFVEPFDLRLERQTVSLAALAGCAGRSGAAIGGAGARAGWGGARLVHLTDLHLRHLHPDEGGRERRYQELVVRLVRAARPDLIVLTGDYMDFTSGRKDRLRWLAAELGRICPGRVCAVLGDNDLAAAAPAAAIAGALAAGGVRVLRNQGAAIAVNGSTLFIAGVDDPLSKRADLQAALADRPAGAPVALLAHSACIWPEAEQAGVDLLCSGHTHGGQVCFPLVGAVFTNDRLGRAYASGLMRRGRLQIHVGRGVGWAKLRMRWRCPPQVAVLELR